MPYTVIVELEPMKEEDAASCLKEAGGIARGYKGFIKGLVKKNPQNPSLLAYVAEFSEYPEGALEAFKKPHCRRVTLLPL